MGNSTIKNNKDIGALQIGSYGLGNFAAQLSWTVVSTYLSAFYTDVVGLAPAAAAMILLIAKIWDAINDPMMGAIMDRTHTKWGQYRPYILGGSIVLVLFSFLTFSSPNLSTNGKIVYALLTYIGLGMSYTVMNVPFGALPSRLTRNPKKVTSLYGCSMVFSAIGMCSLTYITIPCVNFFGHGDAKLGYKYTATLFAFIALLINILVVKTCKENVVLDNKKKDGNSPKIGESLKAIFANKNLMLLFTYVCFYMIGMMGRVGIMYYFYMYCVGNTAMMSTLMTSFLLFGCLMSPLSPILVNKFGKKPMAMISICLGGVGLLMFAFGPHDNVPYLFLCNFVYSLYNLGGAASGGMTIDCIDAYEYEHGVRADGMAFAISGLMNKVGNAIGSSVGLIIMGIFGYVAGQDVTAQVQSGINISVNLIPGICLFVSAIPLIFYNLNEKKMVVIREELAKRHEAEDNVDSAEA